MSELAVNRVKEYPVFPVGEPGVPWGPAEKSAWLKTVTKKRSYAEDIVSRVEAMGKEDNSGKEVVQYGVIDYEKFGFDRYPLLAVKSKEWNKSNPMILVTGGTHGYETSGALGAIIFAENHLERYAAKGYNVLVHVCQSPWAYETVHRWTISAKGDEVDAVDPNRCWNYQKNKELVWDPPGCDPKLQCQEAMLAMKHIASHAADSASVLLHVDCHETTDTDNTLFIPSKIARDGTTNKQWEPIPDGWYSVANDHAPEPEFHKYVIEAVEKVTHIAEADEKGEMIGEKVSDKGIITIAGRQWQVCGAHTDARYSLTTEVYPQPKRCEPETCNEAQVA
eukprot:CAMPEP_0119121202 /NCGR_PEP_ID=MMETSP1310-20130426/1946_1 /TAXON_ID=464262 /ORGANISM="Genus nov. species nov., Strain RCC2339" /LENGTH=335 /DNA_ID=CAMNT_0007110755 /DNA_START=26 /DNA_END=1029 /DNA_ORIENTATION=+